jgi:type IV secretory pathway TrbL component
VVCISIRRFLSQFIGLYCFPCEGINTRTDYISGYYNMGCTDSKPANASTGANTTTGGPPSAKLPPMGAKIAKGADPNAAPAAGNSTNELDISSSNYDRTKGRARKLAAAEGHKKPSGLDKEEEDGGSTNTPRTADTNTNPKENETPTTAATNSPDQTRTEEARHAGQTATEPNAV